MPRLNYQLKIGSALKELTLFAAPTFLLTLVQALMNLTDMLIASNFGGVEVAAEVGMGGQIAYLVVTAVIGFSTGAAILFGKLSNKKDQAQFYQSVNNYLTLSVVAAFAIAAIMIPLSYPLLKLFGTPDAAMTGAAEYISAQMGGMIFVLLFQAVNALFRGNGKSLPPLIFLTVGAVCNIGLDFLFLTVFSWGALGISLATVAAQAIALMFGLAYILKNKTLDLKKLRFKLYKNDTKQLLKLGIPLGVENTAASVSFLIMTFLVTRAGGADAMYALAASSVCMRLNAFFMLPARATAMAVSATVSRKLAEKQRGEAKRAVAAGFIISISAGIILTAVSFFAAKEMILWFGQSGQVLSFGIRYLKAFSFDYLILPVSVILFGWFDGLGKTGISLTVNLITSFAIRIPLAFLLSEWVGWGITGVGISIPTASAVAALVMVAVILIRFYRTKSQRLK